ncbi:hypothetical protein SmJEL517_g03175 [Synchytrium microbalum]|uniref:RFX-type winged-helix domain-containing protein n=1 Tax=Synchytrium microbalum TaxID=1806994 RepID=A0A507C916_9FUNG|nr:uncharacterized protein SmJEL517_g03175 [Synchytrium microbalum]TPX34033.1 hypothetical protein SmJEL517_g03175 [Synchytrium microbalum]
MQGIEMNDAIKEYEWDDEAEGDSFDDDESVNPSSQASTATGASSSRMSKSSRKRSECWPKSVGADVSRWLLENFEARADASMQREALYSYYVSYHTTSHEEYVAAATPATFGKLIRHVFPKVGTRRLGCRGSSKYHYIGVCVKPDGPLAKSGMVIQTTIITPELVIPKKPTKRSAKSNLSSTSTSASTPTSTTAPPTTATKARRGSLSEASRTIKKNKASPLAQRLGRLQPPGGLTPLIIPSPPSPFLASLPGTPMPDFASLVLQSPQIPTSNTSLMGTTPLTFSATSGALNPSVMSLPLLSGMLGSPLQMSHPQITSPPMHSHPLGFSPIQACKSFLSITLDATSTFTWLCEEVEKLSAHSEAFGLAVEKIHLKLCATTREFVARYPDAMMDWNAVRWIVECDIVLASAVLTTLHEKLLLPHTISPQTVDSLRSLPKIFAAGVSVFPIGHAVHVKKAEIVIAFQKSVEMLIGFIHLSLCFGQIIQDGPVVDSVSKELATVDAVWAHDMFVSHCGDDSTAVFMTLLSNFISQIDSRQSLISWGNWAHSLMNVGADLEKGMSLSNVRTFQSSFSWFMNLILKTYHFSDAANAWLAVCKSWMEAYFDLLSAFNQKDASTTSFSACAVQHKVWDMTNPFLFRELERMQHFEEYDTFARGVDVDVQNVDGDSELSSEQQYCSLPASSSSAMFSPSKQPDLDFVGMMGMGSSSATSSGTFNPPFLTSPSPALGAYEEGYSSDGISSIQVKQEPQDDAVTKGSMVGGRDTFWSGEPVLTSPHRYRSEKRQRLSTQDLAMIFNKQQSPIKQQNHSSPYELILDSWSTPTEFDRDLSSITGGLAGFCEDD